MRDARPRDRDGAFGLSFTHVADRDELAGLLTGAGLAVVTSPAYGGLTRWVDQAITRDALVVGKP